MANVVTNVKWVSNTEELKKQLLSGIDTISAMKQAVDRTAASLGGTGLFAAANKTAAAIQQLGGVTKLTAAEQERANALITKALEKYQAMGIAAPTALKEIAAATTKVAEATKQAAVPTESLNVSFGKLVASFVTAQAVIGLAKGAFSAITGELAASVKAANEAEKATVQLVAALKAQGTATPSVVSAIQGYASALQKTTIYQDDALEGAAALLVQVGNVMPRDMEKALHAVTNLASGLGVDLHAATLMVAKAAEGNTAALKKAGVQIDETKAKAQGFGFVLDEVEKKFGGQAAAIAGTYEGRLTQLGNTWNNVEESIGRVITQNATLLTAFDLLNQHIDTNTGELKDNQAATNLVSDAVILSAKGLVLFAQSLDAAQTIAAGFFITIRNGAAALGNLAALTLEAVKASALLHGDLALYAQTNKAIEALKAAVKELGDRNAATTARSIAWGNTLETIAAKASALTKELEETRGKTIALTTATDTNKGAWDQHTKAVTDNAAALKKAAEERARVLAKIRELEAVLPQLTHSVGQLDDTELSSIATHLKNVAALKVVTDAFKQLQATLRALQRDDFAFDLTGLEHVGTKTRDIEDLKARFSAAAQDSTKFDKTLRDIGQSFVALGQVASGTFAIILHGVGGAIQGLANWRRLAAQATEDMRTLGRVSAATAAAQRTAAVEMGIGFALTVYNIGKALDASQLAAQHLEQSRAIVQHLGTDFQNARRFSDGLAQSVEDVVKQLKALEDQRGRTRTTQPATGSAVPRGTSAAPGTDEALAQAVLVNDIIKELGGLAHLTAAQLTMVQTRVSDLFTVIAKGGPLGAKALDALDTVLLDMGQSATKSGGLVSQFFVDMLHKAQAAGVELEKVNGFLLEQTKTNIVGGLGSFVQSGKDAAVTLEDVRKKMADIKDERDALSHRGALGESDSKRLAELNKQWADLEDKAKSASGVIAASAITSQGAATALGSTVLVAFEQMRKSGMPVAEIMAQLGPIIDELGPKFDAAGFSGGAAFDAVREMAALAKDEFAGPVISGITGLGKALAGLHNIGALDQATFSGLTEQITGMYGELQKQGKDGPAALRLLQEPLQTIWQLHKDTGLAVDDTTQALLDQAEEQGIIGDKQRPINEQMLLATERIATAVESIATAFGVLPKAAETAASGITTNLGKIKVPTITIPVTYTDPGPVPGGTPVPTVPGKPAGGGTRRDDTDTQLSTGGLVRPWGVQHFAAGGIASPFPGLPRGADTVPAWLSVGELVSNAQQQQTVTAMLQAGVAMARGLAAAAGASGVIGTTTATGGAIAGNWQLPVMPHGRDVIPRGLTPGEWDTPHWQQFTAQLQAGMVTARDLLAPAATDARPAPIFYFNPTVHLTSDDASDTDRVVAAIAIGLREDRGLLRTMIETVAMKKLQDLG